MITYDPLWITLAKKRMKKKDLYAVVSSATVARMGKGEYVALDVIDKLALFLDCEISDIVARDRQKEAKIEETEKT